MLIILTGPPGAGKTTIGNLLAYRFPKSVNFSLDDIRHFVKGGYVDPWNDNDEIGQSAMATEVAIEMARKYVDWGYVVILDDVFDDNGVTPYRRYFDDVHAFLLLPSLETLHGRDAGRPEDIRMGNRVDEVYADLVEKEYELLTVVDSTDQSPEDTSEVIYSMLDNESVEKAVNPASIYHTTILVSDFKKSLSFYDGFFALLGWESHVQEADAKAWSNAGFSFWITQAKPEDSIPNADGLGINHLAFQVDSKGRVEEAYSWANEMDSRLIDIAPKYFPEYSEGYYSLFLFDPDGARLEVVCK